ncbi:hypothetical protein MAR_004576 [Mya arenaria]|uniref:Uncharacterized protein n=1 Tax=Mya arenaria TaxID=6604 RepID=A0ABY7F573_MYAAR|nr:hypothetical protein MAR_004576 [Mya arenaria]
MGFIPMPILALLVVTVAGRALKSKVSGEEHMQNDDQFTTSPDTVCVITDSARSDFTGRSRSTSITYQVTDTSHILKGRSTDELITTAFVTANGIQLCNTSVKHVTILRPQLLRKNLSPSEKGELGC